MRKVIAALQVSLDGFIEGPQGELDWAMADDEELWADLFEMLDSADACVLGRVMYPDYERYWLEVLAHPTGPLPSTGQAPSEHEVAYARWADRTPHFVLSRTLEAVEWKTTRILRDLEEVRRLKQQPGRDIYAVGGATLVSSLLNAGLVDELHLVVNPLLLGGGKALFGGVEGRRALTLLHAKSLPSGKVRLIYRTES